MVGKLDHLLDVIAMRNHKRSPSVLSIIGLTLALTTLPGQAGQQTSAPTLQDLQTVDEIRAMFNRDAGKVRLILLLSPT